MVGILILAHGSRAVETEVTLSTVVDMVREMLPETLVQIAYMEFGKTNIEAGIDKLVATGTRQIKVIPYFLFDGIHIQHDIPEEIEKYKIKHPDVSIDMGRTLGADRRLAEIVKDRIEEALQ